jgi:hypothetical protein
MLRPRVTPPGTHRTPAFRGDGDYTTKDEAVAEGRKVAEERGAELLIKNQDGTIAEKDSHGNDPRDIPG